MNEEVKNAVEIRNAVISSTNLGFLSHGIFQFYVNLNYGSSGQGFGGYGLDDYNKATDKRHGTAFGCEAIIQVLKTVGVNQWEELVGKSVRVVTTRNKIKRIGHYLDDKWLDLEELSKEFYEDGDES
jgi:hypothetical protein